MTSGDSFLESPDGTREEIMRATYLALCEHGYADLTIQRIGEEFPKSKSLIYHHYDGKDQLLRDFLSFMVERFEEGVPFEDAEGPDDHLDAVLDHALVTPLPERRREFTRAMIELRGQAAHDADYREHFTRHDRFFTERVAAIVEAGFEAGVFREVDPDAVATFLVATIHGAMVQRATSDADPAATVREGADAYVRAVLLEDG
jgi:AcrR family transcriptional regulator